MLCYLSCHFVVVRSSFVCHVAQVMLVCWVKSDWRSVPAVVKLYMCIQLTTVTVLSRSLTIIITYCLKFCFKLCLSCQSMNFHVSDRCNVFSKSKILGGQWKPNSKRIYCECMPSSASSGHFIMTETALRWTIKGSSHQMVSHHRKLLMKCHGTQTAIV